MFENKKCLCSEYFNKLIGTTIILNHIKLTMFTKYNILKYFLDVNILLNIVEW